MMLSAPRSTPTDSEIMRLKARPGFHASVAAVLARISYKPQSVLTIDSAGALCLETEEYALPDAREEGRIRLPWTNEDFLYDVCADLLRPDAGSLAEVVVGRVRQVIHEEEKHEADEWIAVDGLHIFDPHQRPQPVPTCETERVCPCGITFYADHPCTAADGVEDVCLDCCPECSGGGASCPS